MSQSALRQSTLLVCPHCGGCVEILGPPPRQPALADYLCDCGGVLDVVDEADTAFLDTPPRAGVAARQAL